MSRAHVPVLVKEVCFWVRPQECGCIADLTVGAGGHARALMQRMPSSGRLLGVDWDAGALAEARGSLGEFGDRAVLWREGFNEALGRMREAGWGELDAALLDLGLSQLHLSPERGFSFRQPGPLDMRMDRHRELTAEKVVNEWNRASLCRIFREYGEVRHPERMADAIIRQRRRESIRTTEQLARLAAQVYGRRARRRLHPATLVFQAVRIAVNGELDNLRKGLREVMPLLRPGGRLVVLSYHSLEDRLVKLTFREDRAAGRVNILTAKPVRPSEEEVAANPRARSARLRVAECAVS